MQVTEPIAPPARYATLPTPGRANRLGEIGRTAKMMNLPLMPWQRQVAEVASEMDSNGDPIYGTVVVTVPRQAGKSVLLSAVGMAKCAEAPGRQVWYTAQTRAAARDMLMLVGDRVSRSKLAGVTSLRRSNGSEGLYLANGSFFRVFAPTDDALHGTSNHLVCVDEGWAFDEFEGAGLMQAIIPTFTTTGGQLWIISTAGDLRSSWLRGFVDRGRAAVDGGDRESIAYFEWSLDDQADATNLDAVMAMHPANGHTVKRRVLADAQGIMTPEEFARAYGNQWSQVAEQLIDITAWKAAEQAYADSLGTRGSRNVIGIDVGMDGGDAAVTIAFKTPQGQTAHRLIKADQGASWLLEDVPRIAREYGTRDVVVDARCPAPDLVAALAKVDALDVRIVSAGEYIGACSMLVRQLRDRSIMVEADPKLSVAAASAGRRIIGDGWVFSRRSSAGSIAPLVAASLAGWGVWTLEIPGFVLF